MDRGRDFLRAQVSNAVMQHKTLIENLEDHAKQAKSQAYRQVCERHLPGMREHQRMLEEYRASLGEEGGQAGKKVLGALLGFGRDVADAMRESDFLRIVGDVVTIRQAQDTFGTFARVGDRIGEPRLAALGRNGEQDHARMADEFNQVADQIFIEHAKEG